MQCWARIWVFSVCRGSTQCTTRNFGFRTLTITPTDFGPHASLDTLQVCDCDRLRALLLSVECACVGDIIGWKTMSQLMRKSMFRTWYKGKIIKECYEPFEQTLASPLQFLLQSRSDNLSSHERRWRGNHATLFSRVVTADSSRGF